MDGLQQNQQSAAAAHPQEPPQTVLSSTYPPAPMEYVNQFTDENIKNGKAPQPPKIIKDNYTSFGRVIDPNDVLIRSLESQGIQRLYSTATGGSNIDINEHKKELKKLNHSILIAYLDLLEILVKAPNTQIQIEQTQSPGAATTSGVGSTAAGAIDETNQQPVIIYKTLREQKLEDIELLFINMHHLINELRPHQARDNIRCILEMQKQQRVDTARKFKSHLYKIVDLLTKCIESVSEKMDESGSGGEKLIDELNGFMSHAQHLTDELSKFDNTSNNKLRLTNGQDKRVIHDDQEMMQDSENSSSSSVKFVNKKYANSRNCDANDLILCELIDEFLINENEF